MMPMGVVAVESRGKCYICGGSFSKRGMSRHLKSCVQKLQGNRRYYLLRVLSDIPFFWLYIGVEEGAKLRDIDKFLRNIWLECCEHLSCFEFEHIHYVSNFSDKKEEQLGGFLKEILGIHAIERSMDTPVREAFESENKCRYVYDYGSSTVLEIELLHPFNTDSDKIFVVARNELPEIVCDVCGRRAEYLCTEGRYAWLCKKHAKKCRSYAKYRILNSPRIGVCGYGA